MDIINLTPHDILIIQNGEVVRRYPPSGKVARVEEWDEPAGELDGIPAVRKHYGAVQIISREAYLSKEANPAWEEFPAEQEGICYIVPMLVGQRFAGQRNDLFGPDFGIGGVRTADGKLSGAARPIRY